jgi:16S rRNA (guanine527-N7)-methyltransferase
MRDSIKPTVSRETFERLELYASLLQKWTKKINLISRSTVDDLWSRHIDDSIQVYDFVLPSSGLWVDLGSGAGLPGVIIAILAAERAPDLRVRCVESDLRKAAFLTTAARELGLQMSVEAARIETLVPQRADYISARALAPFDKLCAYAHPHLSPDGLCLFQKGVQHEKERLKAEKNWQFDLVIRNSRTNPQAVIYKIGALRRAT